MIPVAARGIARACRERYYLSVEDLGCAIAIDPSKIEAIHNGADLRRNMGEPEQAVRDHDETNRLEPDNPPVHQ